MTDKRTTLDQAVAAVESRMTIGIGGLGLASRDMFIRALLRTDVTDDRHHYGGTGSRPAVLRARSEGLLRFVSLDSPPFYDPWFAKAAPPAPSRPADGRDAALRPAGRGSDCRSLPIRPAWAATCGAFWGDELKTVHSPTHRRRVMRTDGDAALNLRRRPVPPEPRGRVRQRRIHRHRPVLRRSVPRMSARRRLLGGKGGAHKRIGQISCPAATSGQPDDGRHRGRGAQRGAFHHQRTRLPARREVPAASTPRRPVPTTPGPSSCPRTRPAARPTTRRPSGSSRRIRRRPRFP